MTEASSSYAEGEVMQTDNDSLIIAGCHLIPEALLAELAFRCCSMKSRWKSVSFSVFDSSDKIAAISSDVVESTDTPSLLIISSIFCLSLASRLSDA